MAIETRLSRRAAEHDAAIAGIDALELGDGRGSRAARVWAAAWPKLAAIAIVLVAWELLVWSAWRPPWALPGPRAVFARLWVDLFDGALRHALWVTLRRGALGYGLAIAIGGMLGVGVARSRLLRSAIGSLITGLQTMPSIAWFPLAILLFARTEAAILFVVVLGAAPSIANGVLSGIDHVPPQLIRAGRSLGASGLVLQRHVVVPAALPGVVAGLKQGWAFAWRSLMAGELLVIIAKRPSLGVHMTFARDNSDAEGLVALMVVVLIIGILVDSLLFGRLERAVRSRFGLIDNARPVA